MRLRDLLPLSLKAILINKGRSVLTMLGIVIGIMSVIVMIAVGQAAERYLLSQVASFGSDLLFVANGSEEQAGNGPPDATTKQSLTVGDVKKLKGLGWTRGVSAMVITNDLVSYGGQERIVQISGSSPDELVVFAMNMEAGRYLEDADIEGRARVAVLGISLAEKLYGEEDPIGKTVKIAKRNFRVIGILAPSGTRFFSNVDDGIYIPYSTTLELYNKTKLNFIAVKTGEVHPNEAKELVRVALRESHNLDNPEGILSKDDFQVAGQEDAIQNAGVIGSILQILLGSIASISLIVAGIGIMNIMYVTVTERTREIGLRKAIGAGTRDILGQFLGEAVMLCVVAGFIGIALGTGISWLAITIISSFQGGWTFVVPWGGVAVAFGVSSAIGIIFGYFPAKRAAKLNSVEALRFE